jgi:hypothetical protein
MKKLTTFLSVVALATTMTVAGCKKNRDTEAKDETMKPMEDKQSESTTPEAAKPEATKPEAAKPSDQATNTLPAECNDYKALVDKLASCDKIPAAARDSLNSSYQTAAKSWATPPADDAAKKALADQCKAGADAVRTAAAKDCGW